VISTRSLAFPACILQQKGGSLHMYIWRLHVRISRHAQELFSVDGRLRHSYTCIHLKR
jgi:hypothetical protein